MKILRILESCCKTVAKGHFWERATQRGHSSAGRALRWQRRGQGFDPPWLHQNRNNMEQNIDKLFSMNFIGTWLITLLLIAIVIFASYKIFNIMFKSEMYFKKSAISYFLVFVFIFGFLIYFYS